MYADLEGRVAVVTGGAGEIGMATCRRLASEGVKLVVVDLDRARAETAAAELPGEAIGVGADVATEEGVDAYMTAAIKAFGTVDLHYLNAGISGRPALQIADSTVAEWDQVMAVNLRGPFIGIRAAFAHYAERGRPGAIVVTASAAGLSASADLIAYTTSKHGVIGLIRAAAVYGGPVGVRVNGVAPGVIPSELFGPDGKAEMTRRAQTSPLRRGGLATEIAAAVAFLLSDESSYVEGAILSVDGGSTVVNTSRFSGGAGLWDTDSVDSGVRATFSPRD